MKKYRHLFFDLDHTLWDFEKNSSEALHDLHHKYNLFTLGIHSASLFAETYQKRNDLMWEWYDEGKINKETLRNKRFSYTFSDLGLSPDLVPGGMVEEYMHITPRKQHLVPHALEILDHLKQDYSLHLITNGFEETQHIKLASTGLSGYFANTIISETVGYKKPDKNIFLYALHKAGTSEKTECIMIGDTLTSDILGAKSAGIDQVYFNPKLKPHSEEITHEIKNLLELKNIL